jgi:AmmeMemoRadiSam system protein A
MNDTERGTILLGLARNAIAERFGLAQPMAIEDDWLRQPGATFVTLTQQGKLRGCIGSLLPHRPLYLDVRENALAAAFRDSRFPPLQVNEFEDTLVEVSLLSPMQPIAFEDEQDVLSRLRPGVDGIVLEYAHHRGTFLPQVWEQLPSPAAFMTQLKRKAGLPGDFWAPEVRLSRYTVEKWKEAP